MEAPLPGGTAEDEGAVLAGFGLRCPGAVAGARGSSSGSGRIGEVKPLAGEEGALLQWALALDFDAYTEAWLAAACTLASEAATAAVRGEPALLKRLEAAAPVGGSAEADAGGGCGGGGGSSGAARAPACVAAAAGGLPMRA
jgi:hypothetical protein